MWFKPSASPSDCLYLIGAGGAQTCTDVVAAAHTTADTPCAPVTVAITLADGRVAKLRDDWC